MKAWRTWTINGIDRLGAFGKGLGVMKACLGKRSALLFGVRLLDLGQEVFFGPIN